MLKIRDIVSALDQRADPGTAETWDNVGLLVGDSSADTAGAVVSIDLTAEALETAERLGQRLIVNHHPCIFPSQKGLVRVVAQGASQLVYRAAQKGIAVYATHTNFDRCALEVVERASQALGVTPIGRLLDGEALKKLVVYVPETHLEAVRTALWDAGAGHIGRYDQCSFGVAGEGTFRAGEGAKPFLGRSGEREAAREFRLEVVLPSGLEARVLAAMRRAHPYEEVAFDLIPTEQAPAAVGLSRGLGYGFYGDLLQPTTLPEFADQVARVFGVAGLIATPPVSDRPVRRIAYAAGKGGSFAQAARRAGCDVFVTGEAGYHTARSASSLTVLEVGHRESERFFAPVVAGWLSELGLATHSLDSPTQSFWTSNR